MLCSPKIISVEKQKKNNISVIISNPPYSVGQTDANDNNQNLEYADLDSKIRSSYAIESKATNKNSLYDSYIRGIKWASERIGDEGVIGFVTNGSFIDSNVADGLRKCLGRDFSKIYCLNLRGNQRTSGELSRQEGGKIFGSGSRTPVAVTLFVRSKTKQNKVEIYYHDIGDYLSREEKLRMVSEFRSVKSIPWARLVPNSDGDWINQRNPEFESFLPMAEETSQDIFVARTRGLETTRDAWVYNFDKKHLASTVEGTISFYNKEVSRLQKLSSSERTSKKFDLDEFVNKDKTKISWSSSLLADLKREKQAKFEAKHLVTALYRPFTLSNVYFDDMLNHRTGKWSNIFPTPTHKNRVFSLTGLGVTKTFSLVMTDKIPDIQLLANGQCFPLYIYDNTEQEQTKDMFSEESLPDKSGYTRRNALTDSCLTRFHSSYGDTKIAKEDIFYYIYGLLHSPTYRSKYQNDLKKMLPRIPFVKDFWGYSKRGRELAEAHLNYESIEPFDLTEEIKEGAPKKTKELYRVNEAGMKFPKVKKQEDRTTIMFNQFVTLKGIPESAYEYVVNGKPAIEWIMERYAVTTDKDSGIKNDPNEWSDDPRYIVDLVKSIVRVSLETNRIVSELPKFELIEEKKS